MSSSDRRWFLIGLGAVVGVAGCGFAPAYGPNGAANALVGRVLPDAPSDRNSYLLNRRIEEQLGRSDDPRFGLAMSIETKTQGLGITSDGGTTRFNLTSVVGYALRDLKTNTVLTKGEVRSFTGYSATGSTVATLAASQDARERLMVILGDQIIERLIAAAPGFVA